MSWPASILETLRRLEPSRVPSSGALFRQDGALIERSSALLAAGIRIRGTLGGPPGIGKSTALHRLAGALRHGAEPILVRVSNPWRFASHIPRWIALASQVRGALPPLLLVDGLDRLPVELVATALGPGGVLCDERLPSMILTVPASLLVLDLRQHRDSRFNLNEVLFPVSADDASGLEALGTALARRLAGTGVISDRALLQRVARSSGGIPGASVRILREAVLAAGREGAVALRHIAAGERLLRAELRQSVPSRPALTAALDGEWFVGDPRLVDAGVVLPITGGGWRIHPLLKSDAGFRSGTPDPRQP